MKHLILLCLSLGITSTSFAYSAYGNKSLFIRVNSISYSDINLSADENAEKEPYESALDLKVGLQVRNVYYLTGTFLDSDSHKSYGGGIKMRLPGFFLIGGSVSDLFNKKEGSRMQTFLSYSILETTYETESLTKEYVENVFSLNIHVRVVNELFLSGEASLRTFLGDQVYSFGGGLGFGF